MLHCLTDQTLLGQRRLAPNLSGYGLGSFVNFAFLSPSEQPHTRRSGGVKHRLTRARCKGILRKETIKRRSFGEQFRPQTSRLEIKYQYRRGGANKKYQRSGTVSIMKPALPFPPGRKRLYYFPGVFSDFSVVFSDFLDFFLSLRSSLPGLHFSHDLPSLWAARQHLCVHSLPLALASWQQVLSPAKAGLARMARAQVTELIILIRLIFF